MTIKQERKKTLATLEREAFIRALDAEARKHRLEEGYLKEETARLEYERMERETWDRARRVLTISEEVTDVMAWEVIETLSDWAHESDADITLRLMQPGGDIVYGLAIFDFVTTLRDEEGIRVDTHAYGFAPSMGSILLQCGETRIMAPNSFMLIHEGRTRYTEEMVGYVERFSDREDDLKFSLMLEDRCDAILAERSTFDPVSLRATYTRRDWWITAHEAVTMGFADTIRPARAV